MSREGMVIVESVPMLPQRIAAPTAFGAIRMSRNGEAVLTIAKSFSI
jgi:hypothetical protein